MIEGEVEDMVTNTTICDQSYWIYSSKGRFVEVLSSLAGNVQLGQIIAKVCDVFAQMKE